MNPIAFARLLSADEDARLLQAALDLLAEPGMRIGSAGLLHALGRAGASADDATGIVRFPAPLVRQTLEQARGEEAARRDACGADTLRAAGALTFSWHTPFMTSSPPFQASLGGGCPLYYDHAGSQVRYASETDLVRMLHLAEGLPEIVTCGNPVHCVLDADGRRNPPELMPILGAAAIARNSSKPGASALMSPWQLDYLVAIGEVVRGGRDAYHRHPVFINVNDTVPPLELSRPEGEIIEALAARGLPVYILPMPLMGVAAPVTVLASAAVAIAEILGVWTAAKALNPEVPLECSVVAGALEPRTGNPCFSAPEAAAIDLAVAQFFRNRGLRCGTGVGFIDAPVPGVAAVYERTQKAVLAALAGESSYPVGILAAGNVFSPEQLMLDLDIGAGHHHFLDSFDGGDLDEAVALVRQRGIGGMFLDTDHTAEHFRRRLWVPRVFVREKTKDPRDAPDPVRIAHERWTALVAQTPPYVLPDDKAREIDRIVDRARKAVTAGSGSTARMS